MIPTETDRFLAEIRGAAEGGAQIMPYDVLRILRIVEYQGREILRLRVSEPQPASGPRSLNAELVALGVPRVTVALLSADERRALIRAALREASAADFESESVRRTEAASPDDLPSLPPPSPVPPASAGSAPDLSDAAGSGGGSPPKALKPGDRVRYYPSGRGHQSHTGTVRDEPRLLGEHTWVVTLHEMDATYKRGEGSVVHAAALDALDLIEPRSPVCPDCGGNGHRAGVLASACLTCAGEGRIGGGR